jgi:cell division control protein 24
MSINTSMATAYGPAGYPPHDGFEPDDDYEDYPSPLMVNGRATPMDIRRETTPTYNQYATQQQQQQYSGFDRRVHTEDVNGAMLTQWRQQNGQMMPPPPATGLPNGPRMTTASRMNSATSFASDSSFGNGIRHSSSRPSLRSQMSQSRLRQDGDPRSTTASPVPPSLAPGARLPSRSRSASQPSAYVPKNASLPPPPLPNTHWDRFDRTVATSSSTTEMKRSSGSSQSTGDESSSSPGGGSSPITSLSSSDSSLPAAFTKSSLGGAGGVGYAPQVKVKVHFGSDIFVIQVPRSYEYHELVEKVGKKIRLCGPRRDDGPLRVKYEDEEGDLISMRSTEDVEMAFSGKPQVVLHVA